MKIMFLGLRGIPQIQGGVETHVEQLARRLIKEGHQVEVLARSPYVDSKERCYNWAGIKITKIWSPQRNGVEAFVHTFLGVIYAAIKRPDILHIHAIGPGIMTPFAKLAGLKVVFTHHGFDYDREKWGVIAKAILRVGEFFALLFSDRTITVSKHIKERLGKQNSENVVPIHNGVEIPDYLKLMESATHLEPLGVHSGNYILQVSRIVPEKRQIDLVDAFVKANLDGWQLLIVGGLNEKEEYTQRLIERVKNVENVLLVGFQEGIALGELYANASIFVLPSTHEGLPIAMLEALSYGLRVVASNIPANLEVGLPSEHYFEVGKIDQLALALEMFSSQEHSVTARQQTIEFVRENYDWDKIALQTLELYKEVV